MKKVALIGASSSIGRRLAPYLETHLKNYAFIKTCHSNSQDGYEPLDIRDKKAIEFFLQKHAPDTLIWLAGTKDIKKCQEDYDFAYLLNTQPIIDVCSILKHTSPSPHIIFISTDYVFDGSTGDYTDKSQPQPVTNYGKTNYLAERALLASQLPWTIVRTAAIMGKGFNYFDWLTSSLKAGERVESFADSIFTPTPIELFNQAVLRLITDLPLCKILHVVGDMAMSRYEFSKMIAAMLGREEKIIPIYRKNLFQRNLSLVQSHFMRPIQSNTLQELLKSEL